MKLDCFYASGYILKTQGTSTKTLGMMSMVYGIDMGVGLRILQKSLG
mgnify:FL=1